MPASSSSEVSSVMRGRLLWLVPVVGVVVASCLTPSPQDGALLCNLDPGGKACPDGYTCRDGACYHSAGGGGGDMAVGGGLKALGDSCATGDECDGGFCVDGVCCNRACDGQCEACDATDNLGTCVPVAGAPHGSRTACTATDATCAGACDGNSPTACVYPTTPCGATTCTSNMESGLLCSNGACVSSARACSGGFACGASACAASCDASAGCDGTHVCSTSGKVCLQKIAFGAPATFTCNMITAISGVIAADLNGDSAPDLIVYGSYMNGSANMGRVETFLNKGTHDFTFTFKAGYATGINQRVYTGDLDNNGKTDMVIYEGNGVSTLLGVGDGTFTAKMAVTNVCSLAQNEPEGLVVAKLNGDAFPDVAVSCVGFGIPGSVDILTGNGDGTLTYKSSPSQTGTELSRPMAAADWDQNGTIDLVAAGSVNGESASVFKGTGDGTFTHLTPLGPTAPVRDVVARDFDGDGFPDIAFIGSNTDPSELAVYRNNRDGTFTKLASPTLIALGNTPTGSLVTADVNGDGRVDLLAMLSNPSANKIDVLAGSGDGLFVLEPKIPLSVGTSQYSVVQFSAADFDGDKKIDVVAGTNAQVSLFPNVSSF